MKFPKKVKIGGHNWGVRLDPNLHKETDSATPGCCCLQTQTIVVDNSYSEEFQEEVFLHEMIEAINFQYELELEHHVITTLSNAFFQVFKDNPINFREGKQ